MKPKSKQSVQSPSALALLSFTDPSSTFLIYSVGCRHTGRSLFLLDAPTEWHTKGGMVAWQQSTSSTGTIAIVWDLGHRVFYHRYCLHSSVHMTHFNVVLLFWNFPQTMHSLLSASMVKHSHWPHFPLLCLCFHPRAFALTIPFIQKVFPCKSHVARVLTSCRPLLRCHFLLEASVRAAFKIAILPPILSVIDLN